MRRTCQARSKIGLPSTRVSDRAVPSVAREVLDDTPKHVAQRVRQAVEVEMSEPCGMLPCSRVGRRRGVQICGGRVLLLVSVWFMSCVADRAACPWSRLWDLLGGLLG